MRNIILCLSLWFWATCAGWAGPIPEHELKISCDSGSLTHWRITVSVNGHSLGAFSDRLHKDITAHLRPGKNNLKIQADLDGKLMPVAVTVGAKRGGKWATTVSCQFSEPGSKRLDIPLEVPDLPEQPRVAGPYVLKLKADSGTMGRWVMQVWVNGMRLGVYRSWGDVDMTAFMVPGKNTVKIQGDLDGDLTPIEVTLGKPGASGWATLLKHVQQKKGNAVRSYTVVAKDGLAAAPAEKCILKVQADSASSGNWTLEVYLNGELLQTLTAPTSVDITNQVKPGLNDVKLVGHWTAPTTPVEITVGALRGGSWSTLVKVTQTQKGTLAKECKFKIR